MRASTRRASALIVAAAAIAALVAGCTPSPGPSGAPPSSAAPGPSASTPAEPAPTQEPAPTFDPAAAAETNLPVVESALSPLVSAGGIPAGRSVVDALTGAGIPLSELQVTPDRTAIGLPVDALLFSVRSGDSCVLGQFDGDGFTTTTAPALASGACLVGATASLD
ncbi:MAG: hypothetical protein Q7T15_12005 [Microcella sp.]|uniref:DUF6993 domain-containing protein n=1 Tax=Microcella sp. TaxID=1913979 RepID=UPI00271ABECF|nr:hypothetical protein [Microcella sp.]MDO8338960.1 hypothetical protein [Microcella sp.]